MEDFDGLDTFNTVNDLPPLPAGGDQTSLFEQLEVVGQIRQGELGFSGEDFDATGALGQSFKDKQVDEIAESLRQKGGGIVGV